MATTKDKSKNAVLAVLKTVTKMLGAMSQDDLEALTSGRARLVLVRDDSASQQPELAFELRASSDLEHIKNALGNAETTDAGFAILTEANLTRAELERMARWLDLPVTKHDSIRRLAEKIVEALIGSRLNSRAVRGR